VNAEETSRRLADAATLMNAQTISAWAARTGFHLPALMRAAEELQYDGESTLASIWLTGFNTGYLAAELAEGDRISGLP
jgi:hypothetical protein